uniref:Calpain 10 n=1 Tax=Oryctolagus cuniculus TaxID=9986 RepID=A0A5F9DVD2_RABIT
MRAGRGETPAPAAELFRDTDFPASDSSLCCSLSTPLAQFREDITWRRPQEICVAPRLFPDNAREGQVKQGLLGDCWFLCACAALQKHRHLLDQVIPPGQPSWADEAYRGAFTCRVWQFGRWVEVTVDDRLPCLAGRLCFSRCRGEDVFWLPLLEKVYAKVHGSYEQLWAGQVADALVDLTGGLAERWDLKALAGASGQQDGHSRWGHRSCRRLLGLKDRCLLSCSVLSPRPGAGELGEFHAFVVSDLRELPSRAGHGVLLLRIHNPWGRRCWQGRWRAGGEGWSQVEPADQAELLAQLQEGEFWVEEEEFLREFDEVTVGYPVTEAGHLQSLYTEKVLCHTRALPGAWVKGQSAGGCRNNSGFPSNPKFWLRVSEPSEVYVAVLQKPRPRATHWVGRAHAPAGTGSASWSPASLPGKDYQAVGLHIWKVTPPHPAPRYPGAAVGTPGPAVLRLPPHPGGPEPAACRSWSRNTARPRLLPVCACSELQATRGGVWSAMVRGRGGCHGRRHGARGGLPRLARGRPAVGPGRCCLCAGPACSAGVTVLIGCFLSCGRGLCRAPPLLQRCWEAALAGACPALPSFSAGDLQPWVCGADAGP